MRTSYTTLDETDGARKKNSDISEHWIMQKVSWILNTISVIKMVNSIAEMGGSEVVRNDFGA